jgi:hypothetical protein
MTRPRAGGVPGALARPDGRDARLFTVWPLTRTTAQAKRGSQGGYNGN